MGQFSIYSALQHKTKPMSIKSSLVLVSCKSTKHYVQLSRNHLGTNLLRLDWTSSKVRNTFDGSLTVLINLTPACVHVIGDVFMNSCHELWFGHVLKMCLALFNYSLIAIDERVTFLASAGLVTALCMCVHCIAHV